MSRLRFCFLLAVLYGHVATMTTPQPPEVISLDTKTTESPDIPTTTTPATTTSTTTPSTTTSSTTPSTTTSTTPASTTSTTTPPTTTSTTTPVPVTTTTPAPTPKPQPDQVTFSYTDMNNVTCIVVQFAAQLNVNYMKSVNKSTVRNNTLINIPGAANVTGNCTGDQWITISWNTTDNSSVANTMTLTYHLNDTTKSYGLRWLNISLAADNFPNISTPSPIVMWHGPEWLTPLATSYRCKVPTQLNMTSDTSNVAAALTLTHLQEEAYRTVPGTGFSAARECGGGDVPDAVPIAVGCALGGLVVVVLVAYLLGRRRSARGYLSM